MKQKRWSVRKGLSLAVILLCMAGHLYVVWHAGAALPRGVEISGEEEIRLDETQIETLESSDRYSFSMRKLLTVESTLTKGDFEGKEYPDRAVAAEGWYTDSRYGETCRLSMADGTYFQVNPAAEFSQTAVISEELALRLFFRTDAAGETLQIDGKNYEICGVYKKDTGLTARMSQSRFDRIYLPYPAYPKEEEGVYPVRFFYDRQEGKARFPEKVIKELEEQLGTELPILQTADLTEYGELIWQTFRLALFFAGLLLEAGLFMRVWRLVFAGQVPFRAEERGDRIRRMGYLAGILALMVAIGAVIAFSPVIPAQYLPRENIFQLSVYLDALADTRRSENSRMIYSMYQGMAGRTLWLGTGFLAVEAMGCLQAALLWKNGKKDAAGRKA